MIFIKGVGNPDTLAVFCLQGDDFIVANKLFSWLGSVMGMPLIAAGLLKRNGHHMFVLPYTIAPLAFLFLYKTLPSDLKNLGNSTLSTVAVLSIAVSSILVQNYHGIYSAIAIILAATVIGTDGKILGVQNVDIFHYVLAIGNMFYCWSLN